MGEVMCQQRRNIGTAFILIIPDIHVHIVLYPLRSQYVSGSVFMYGREGGVFAVVEIVDGTIELLNGRIRLLSLAHQRNCRRQVPPALSP
jgi:hypothetical protein